MSEWIQLKNYFCDVLVRIDATEEFNTTIISDWISFEIDSSYFVIYPYKPD